MMALVGLEIYANLSFSFQGEMANSLLNNSRRMSFPILTLTRYSSGGVRAEIYRIKTPVEL